MSNYECVFIARQDISQAQVDGLTETFEKIISDHDGSVKKTEQWGLRTLAYKIKKNRKGYYVLFNIDAPAPAVHEMERQMKINEDVLRFLTTRVDELEEGPSAVLRAKDRDDDRDRGRRPHRDFDKKPVAADVKPAEDKAPEEKPAEDKAPEAEAKADEKDKADDTAEKAAAAEDKADDEAEKEGEDK